MNTKICPSLEGEQREQTQECSVPLKHPPRCGNLKLIINNYISFPFILLTPLDEDSSFIILNLPNTDVFSICGPPHISIV